MNVHSVEELLEKETTNYTLTLYYDEDLRGVADEKVALNFDEAVDMAHEMIGKGGYLTVEQEFSGKMLVISYDDYFKGFEGESPLREFEFDTHDTEIREIQLNLYNQYIQEWVDEHVTEQDWDAVISEYENTIADETEPVETFKEFVEETGFGNGSCYVCFEEFLDYEYQDKAWRTAHVSERDETILQKYDELKTEVNEVFKDIGNVMNCEKGRLGLKETVGEFSKEAIERD